MLTWQTAVCKNCRDHQSSFDLSSLKALRTVFEFSAWQSWGAFLGYLSVSQPTAPSQERIQRNAGMSLSSASPERICLRCSMADKMSSRYASFVQSLDCLFNTKFNAVSDYILLLAGQSGSCPGGAAPTSGRRPVESAIGQFPVPPLIASTLPLAGSTHSATAHSKHPHW